MMSSEEIKKLFELARISPDAEELLSFPDELSRILEYVAKLGAVPMDEVPPMVSIVKSVNQFRGDAAEENPKFDLQFPEEENGYLKTKNVFSDSNG